MLHNKTISENDILTELNIVHDSINRLLSDSSNFAIMGFDGITLQNAMRNLRDKERTLKMEYAKKMHVKNDGSPRSISQDGKGLYFTKTKDKDKFSAKTIEDLYVKLFDEVYGTNINFKNTSFESIYSEMINEKNAIVSANGNISNLNNNIRVEQDYKRFILPELANMDINQIDEDYLLSYTKNLLFHIIEKDGKPLNKKAFDANYCGLLRKIFKYAKSHKYVNNNIMSDFDDLKSSNPDLKPLLDCRQKAVEEKVFQPEQIELLDSEFEKRINDSAHFGEIYNPGYMFKIEKNAGLRAAELTSLKWEDIDFENLRIHVHSQQLWNRETKDFLYTSITKSEKMRKDISSTGRYVPIYKPTLNVLTKLKEKQKELGINSEWVFCHPDGSWLRCDTEYMQPLRRLCQKLGFQLSNNHAIRMYFNSYILIPAGVVVSDRARIMGHNVEVNLKNYTFESAEYCDKTRNCVDDYLSKMA